MRNLDIFDEYATYMVGALHDKFPLGRRFTTKEIVDACRIKPEKGENLHEYASRTLKWLVVVGLLQLEDPDDIRKQDLSDCWVTLSAPAFTIMRLKPPDLLKARKKLDDDKDLGDIISGLADNVVDKAKGELVDKGVKWGVATVIAEFAKFRTGA